LTTLAIGAARGAMRWLDLDKSFPLILTLVGVGSLAAIVAGAVAGGYVVGRWGPRRPVLLGALSGLIAGALAGILNAIVTRTPVALWVAVPGVAVAASSAGVGAWTGARVRAASPGGAEIVQDD
jgi:hypothetical protein